MAPSRWAFNRRQGHREVSGETYTICVELYMLTRYHVSDMLAGLMSSGPTLTKIQLVSPAHRNICQTVIRTLVNPVGSLVKP